MRGETDKKKCFFWFGALTPRGAGASAGGADCRCRFRRAPPLSVGADVHSVSVNAAVGTAAVGTAAVGTAAVGTAAVGTAAVGTAAVGTAASTARGAAGCGMMGTR